MSEPESTSAIDSSDQRESAGQVKEDALFEIRREAELILGEVPEESKTPELVVDAVLKVIQTRRMYSGPHPSPTMLAELKEVDKTFPDRAMSFAEKEQNFRHEIAREEVNCAKRAQWHAFCGRVIGQLLAVGVILGIVVVVAYLLMQDKPVKDLSPIIYALTALAGAIIAAQVVSSFAKKSGADSGETN